MKGILIEAPQTVPMIAKTIDRVISEIDEGYEPGLEFNTGITVEHKSGKRYIIAVSAIPEEEWIDRDEK